MKQQIHKKRKWRFLKGSTVTVYETLMTNRNILYQKNAIVDSYFCNHGYYLHCRTVLSLLLPIKLLMTRKGIKNGEPVIKIIDN